MNFELNEETIDTISKAITQYAFRSWPIEELHSNGHLTQNDMKILNKYMANRIAGLLTFLSNGNYDNVIKVLSFYALQARYWGVLLVKHISKKDWQTH